MSNKRPKRTDKQDIAFSYLTKHPYSILAMDPRLGKTRTIIDIQQSLNINCLVICPGHLVLNWVREIKKWSFEDVQLSAFQKGKDIYEPFDSDFVVISYDLVQKADHLFEWADMVCLDEAHAIKSMSAKRTQFIHKGIFENSIKRVHPMTGTILKNRVREFYSPMALMHYDPRLKDTKFLDTFPEEISFADHFSHRQEYKVRIKDRRGRTYSMPIAKWDGIKNIKELKSWLAGKYIRIKADDKDLPPISYLDTHVSDIDNKAMLDAFNSFFGGEGASSVKSDAKKAAALKKVPFTIKYVDNLLETVDCCLVYSDHVETIEEIARHFKVPAITGKMPGKNRAGMAADFQAGNGRILCATIGALKEGQDLFRSKDIVFNDFSWVPGDMKQVVNRVRGINQTGTRTAHMLFGSPQDEKIWEAIQNKIKVIDAATD